MRRLVDTRIRRLAGVGALLLLAAAGEAGQAGGLVTREEALASVYPGAAIEAEQVFLTAEQQAQATAVGGVPVASRLIARYVARREGAVVGRAYVDTHVVRTKRESLLVSLDDAGKVRRVDVTAFLEPPEYLAPDAWRRQYTDQTLTDDLRLQRAIRPIAGATLTSRAANEAVRRVLAIDQVLERGGEVR